MLIKRIIFDLILLALILIAPWWVGVILALAGIFYFEKLYEVILFGLLMDSIYGSFVIFPNFPYLITTISILLLILILRFKKNLIMY